ncbi:MAG: carbohydrate ABC transporter permease [Actinomycetia bacterium]|nr:carbohydrate ABC transporter permease [Actinomycetes bacterium]
MSTATLSGTQPLTLTRKPTPKDGGWGSPVIYFISLAIIAVCLGPVLYVIMGGFRDNSQINNNPAALPNPFQFNQYAEVLKTGRFWRMAWNSTFIALITVVCVVVFGVCVAFVLARYKFRLRNGMYLLFAAGLMFPMTMAITPLYIMMTRIPGMAGTPWSVILPQVGFGLPQTVIILTPFLAAIPLEIEEAATVDGCSRLGFFTRMVIPLAVPGVITVAILTFVGSWNGYMLPLYMFSDQSQYTLPLGVAVFSSQYSSDTARILAYTSMSMIPALIFFSLFEKRIVGGLTGAVKG